ncbi:glycosyltransferase [Planctopirus limnophila]|uniref:glycosyltransferase n=1 Tax=Planctopirus limnophila TaxID=120 RepID=UPI0002D984B5|nr:glycosyltransferase [Planctopirus limnophila]
MASLPPHEQQKGEATKEIDLTPVLTVGIPTCHDFNGLWPTLIDLHKTQLADDLSSRIEIIVIDNAPEGKHGKPNRDLVSQIPNARYVPFTDKQGTAPAKQEVFRQATGYAVVCLDSHVMLMPGVLARLVNYWESETSDDLFQGPCLHYSMQDSHGRSRIVGTHFSERWGDDGMFGRWGVFEPAKDPEFPPFRIVMNGMGLFSAKRTSWLGFHPEIRGFGGEEGYVQEKYRQAGRQTWCLPWLRWVHRFGYVDGVPYTGLDWRQRAKNYLLGYRELGYPDLSGIRSAYTKPGRLTEVEFDDLMKELGVVPRLRGQLPSSLESRTPSQKKATVNLLLTELQPGEEELLEALPCTLRGRKSGAVLCNIGCPSMQSQLVTTFDCRKHGLVTLGKRRKDLINCLNCEQRIDDLPDASSRSKLITKSHQSPVDRRQNEVELIIGVLSATHHRDKREAIRDTWAPIGDDVESVFIQGDANIMSLSNTGTLRVPCKDTYDTLIHKVQHFCRWATRFRSFKWLFKCDDDTYVSIPRLKEFVRTLQADYVGRNYGGFASGGAGYLLSRKSALVIADAPDLDVGVPEDVGVAELLKNAGILLLDSKQFEGDQRGPWPSHSNNLITGHYLTPARMREIHNAFCVSPVQR